MDFCQILTTNSYVWTETKKSKLLKKKKEKPKVFNPKNRKKLDEAVVSNDLCKIFENITFSITCECEGKTYIHKGLPFGSENSFHVIILLKNLIIFRNRVMPAGNL